MHKTNTVFLDPLILPPGFKGVDTTYSEWVPKEDIIK